MISCQEAYPVPLQLHWAADNETFVGTVVEVDPQRAPFHTHVHYLADDDDEWGYFQGSVFHTADGDQREMRGGDAPAAAPTQAAAPTVRPIVRSHKRQPPPPPAAAVSQTAADAEQQAPLMAAPVVAVSGSVPSSPRLRGSRPKDKPTGPAPAADAPRRSAAEAREGIRRAVRGIRTPAAPTQQIAASADTPTVVLRRRTPAAATDLQAGATTKQQAPPEPPPLAEVFPVGATVKVSVLLKPSF